MITKGRKRISLWLVAAFIGWLPVSAMPLAAADGARSAGMEDSEPGPGFVEAIGQKTAPGKRKSILPYLVIGGGVAAVAAILFLAGKKPENDAPQEYNILGSWTFEFNRRGAKEYFTIVFSGNQRNGEFMKKDSAWMKGTYTVVDTAVTMLTADKPDVHFYGKFTSADMMSGSWSYMSEWYIWTAWRAAISGWQ